MTKHPIIMTIGVLITTSIFFISCQKEESLKTTPWWKLLEGSWQIQKDFKINEVDSVLSDIETYTVFNFIEPSGFGSFEIPEECYWDANQPIWEISENGLETGRYVQGFPYISTSPFNFGEGAVFYSNDVGFAATKQNQYSGYFLPTIFNATLPQFNSKPIVTNTVRAILESVVTKNKFSRSVGECLTKTQASQSIDEISEINYLKYKVDGSKAYYGKEIQVRILKLNESDLNIKVSFPFYGRLINGKEISDIFEFSFKKLNSSSVITVPPFNIESYQKSLWEKFNIYDNSKLKNGCNISSSNSVGNGSELKNSLSLPNTNSYAESTLGDLFQKNSTLSFWIYPAIISKAKQIIYSKYRNQYGPFIISLEDDKFTIELNDGFGNLQKVKSFKAIKKDSWSHIALTIDEESYATLYLNGNKDSGGKLNNVEYDAAGAVLIGTSEKNLNANEFSSNYIGYLDEVMLIKKVLGAGEIYQLYKWHLTN